MAVLRCDVFVFRLLSSSPPPSAQRKVNVCLGAGPFLSRFPPHVRARVHRGPASERVFATCWIWQFHPAWMSSVRGGCLEGVGNPGAGVGNRASVRPFVSTRIICRGRRSEPGAPSEMARFRCCVLKFQAFCRMHWAVTQPGRWTSWLRAYWSGGLRPVVFSSARRAGS